MPDAPSVAVAAARAPSATSWAAIARERGIRSYLVSYTDLFGCQRAKLVHDLHPDLWGRGLRFCLRSHCGTSSCSGGGSVSVQPLYRGCREGRSDQYCGSGISDRMQPTTTAQSDIASVPACTLQ